MNNQTFDHLLNWLEAGAPGYLFSMHFAWTDYSDGEPQRFSHIQAEHKRKPECGTICCIAGFLDQGENENNWDEVQKNALRKLGLPHALHYMIPLFDPSSAGHPPTPKQAAEAVRRFRDHYAIHKDILFDPWSEE